LGHCEFCAPLALGRFVLAKECNVDKCNRDGLGSGGSETFGFGHEDVFWKFLGFSRPLFLGWSWSAPPWWGLGIAGAAGGEAHQPGSPQGFALTVVIFYFSKRHGQARAFGEPESGSGGIVSCLVMGVGANAEANWSARVAGGTL